MASFKGAGLAVNVISKVAEKGTPYGSESVPNAEAPARLVPGEDGADHPGGADPWIFRM